MSDPNTLTIKIEDDGGPPAPPTAPPPAPPSAAGMHPPSPLSFGTTFSPASAASMVPPRAAGPIEVELTRENAELVAGYLRGKVSPDEFLAKIAGAAATTAAAAGVTAAAAAAVAAARVGPVPSPAGGFQLPPRDAIALPGGGGAGQPPVPPSSGVLVTAGGAPLVPRPAPSSLAGGPLAVGGQNAIPAPAAAAGGTGLGLGVALAAGIALDKIADKVIGGVGEKARAGISELGDAAKAAAGNDGLGLLKQGSAATATFLGNTGLAGKVMAEQLRTATQAVETFGEVTKAITDRGRQLAGLDANLAYSTARADVARIEADIREAQRTGPAVSRLIEAENRAAVAMQDTLAPIKSLIAGRLAPILERVATALEGLSVVADVLTSAQENIDQVVSRIIDAALPDWAKSFADDLKAAAREYLEQVRKERADKAQTVLNELLGLAGAVKLDPKVPDQADVQAQQELGVPLLGG